MVDDQQLRSPITVGDDKSLQDWNFMGNKLIQMWIRHQYFKMIIPSLFTVWYTCLIWINTDYGNKCRDSIVNSLTIFQCEVNSTVVVDGDTYCHNLDPSTQYYHTDDSLNYHIRTVKCLVDGAIFYYENNFYDTYSGNYVLQEVINVLAPLIFTYFIYESAYLAQYNLLSIVPDEKDCKRLRYDTITMKIGKWYGGIEMGLFTLFGIITFIMIVIITSLVLLPDSDSYVRCTEKPYIPPWLSLSVGIPLIICSMCFFYYSHLNILVQMDIELVAANYKKVFIERRLEKGAGAGRLLNFILFPLLLVNLTIFSIIGLVIIIILIPIQCLLLNCGSRLSCDFKCDVKSKFIDILVTCVRSCFEFVALDPDITLPMDND